MGQTTKVGTHATTVTNSDGVISTTYHQTTVCTIDTNERTITLDSGGWESATTKLRINQTINEYLGYECRVGVFQEKFRWYVQTADGETVPFVDKMTVGY